MTRSEEVLRAVSEDRSVGAERETKRQRPDELNSRAVEPRGVRQSTLGSWEVRQAPRETPVRQACFLAQAVRL